MTSAFPDRSASETPAQIQANLIAYMRLFSGLPDVVEHDSDDLYWMVSHKGAPGNSILRARWPEAEAEKRIDALFAEIGQHIDQIDWMLYPGWIRGETDPKHVKLANVVDHIDRVCQLAGNAKHAALGTDLDGGFGTEQSPSDIDTIADLQKIPDILKARGYSQADIEGILCGNWVRFFREAWKR